MRLLDVLRRARMLRLRVETRPVHVRPALAVRMLVPGAPPHGIDRVVAHDWLSSCAAGTRSRKMDSLAHSVPNVQVSGPPAGVGARRGAGASCSTGASTSIKLA